ncbi:MAG TPA: hypothetical protein VJ276_10010 [Thermoanaerobaculia bacterium]|nr:hypothetical protein [Thermoanaerobaculia bacterium]
MSHMDERTSETAGRYARVPGWGADLDPTNRPAVPKEKPSNVTNVRGDVPLSRQVPTTKIFMSVEHPDLTPAFGTSCPPRGLSGMLREYAYQYGEGRLRRWMTLMLADRIDVIEGIVDDFSRGHVPNWPKERGLKAEVKYADTRRKSRDLMIAGAAVGIVALVVLWPRITRSVADDDAEA